MCNRYVIGRAADVAEAVILMTGHKCPRREYGSSYAKPLIEFKHDHLS
jgi:hypothetical protein